MGPIDRRRSQLRGRYGRLCPCGSGRRYRDCCFAEDRRAGYDGPLPGEAIEEARQADYWEAGTVPMFPVFLDEEPESRPALAMVAVGDRAIAVESLTRPSAETADVARTLEAVVREARRRVGGLPPELRVRHREVAEALGRRMESSGPRVVSVDRTPALDLGGHLMKAAVLGIDDYPLTQSSYTWAGWDQPRDRVARLHSAAAAVYQAIPWEAHQAVVPIEAIFPDDRRWNVIPGAGWTDRPTLMLQGGEFGPGAPMFPEESEASPGTNLETTGALPPAFETLSAIRGRILEIRFEPGGQLHSLMRRGVSSGGWEVADAEAYPVLYTIHTPGCGLPRRDADDLLAVAGAVPRLLEAQGHGPGAWLRAEWRDPETGLEFRGPVGEGE